MPRIPRLRMHGRAYRQACIGPESGMRRSRGCTIRVGCTWGDARARYAAEQTRTRRHREGQHVHDAGGRAELRVVFERHAVAVQRGGRGGPSRPFGGRAGCRPVGEASSVHGPLGRHAPGAALREHANAGKNERSPERGSVPLVSLLPLVPLLALSNADLLALQLDRRDDKALLIGRKLCVPVPLLVPLCERPAEWTRTRQSARTLARRRRRALKRRVQRQLRRPLLCPMPGQTCALHCKRVCMRGCVRACVRSLCCPHVRGRCGPAD